MPRALWKGSVSFGLVNVPVTLHPAEERSGELRFTLLDSRNHARVRYERKNEETGEEVPWSNIVKGYKLGDDGFVVLTPEDFRKAAVEATRTIEIEDFVARDAIAPAYFDKPYYLAPARGGEKGYVLLRETLKKTGRVGIAKVVIHTRQYLAALLAEGDALVLNVLRFGDELRSPAGLDLPAGEPSKHKISPKELEMARTLVEAMSGDWEPEKYHDEYQQALLRWIEKKRQAGGKAVVAPSGADGDAEPAPGNYSIMELLKKSVQTTKRKPRKPATAGAKAAPARRRKVG